MGVIVIYFIRVNKTINKGIDHPKNYDANVGSLRVSCIEEYRIYLIKTFLGFRQYKERVLQDLHKRFLERIAQNLIFNSVVITTDFVSLSMPGDKIIFSFIGI
ncbi:hypothetical protein RF11_05129 [Thelohanellus kitauei]|uniref:Uncharacterized protein n=1 Tax=Thelohanellus kitauei TaxID=669202 RepID=A0A0C2JIL2_THEKT|nr:hypothetical protein RF11_05129 [Thelohanellus kitauei]